MKSQIFIAEGEEYSPMSGRITHAALRALDRVNRALLPKSKKAEHLQTGRRGEEEAYFYLRGLGYVMVARNWRTPRRKGELDLVGWDGDLLCFIEVKTRTTLDVKPAEAAVDAEKRAELCAMAREYLRLFLTSRPKGGSPTSSRDPQEQTGMSPSDPGKDAKAWRRLLPNIPGAGRAPSPAAAGSGFQGKIRFDVLSIYYLDGGAKRPQFTLFKNCFPMS